jgi:tRNA threonylcarbamoyladenosine biosynthesis protein TsaB
MILSIKTDTEPAELYLDQDGKTIASNQWAAKYQLAEQILQKITDLLRQAKVELSDITGIVVYQGPGSFTGLRIGITVANALAYGQNLPVVGVSGSQWRQEGAKGLARAKPGGFVVPKYGRPPHITKPRK